MHIHDSYISMDVFGGVISNVLRLRELDDVFGSQALVSFPTVALATWSTRQTLMFWMSGQVSFLQASHPSDVHTKWPRIDPCVLENPRVSPQVGKEQAANNRWNPQMVEESCPFLDYSTSPFFRFSCLNLPKKSPIPNLPSLKCW